MTDLHGFELLRDEFIPELNTRARLYRHLKTGAELLSLENDDENKCFGITFRTPPRDSTGIAHILEHSVLCGSRKYPVKDPFFTLVKGSVHTFLNAMTYPDKTTYPVASTNLKDFYNLVDVYLDAVFFPRITPEVLKQEGWHFELPAPDAPLTIKGVVYNEMKGAYSSPDGMLYRYSQQSLFPDTTYGHSSGGDPQAIPDLTYEAFKRFHETLYHPSNARIFFYGDDPPEERLRKLDEYLSQFERIEPSSQIEPQARFSAPREFEYTFSADEDNQKGMVMLNWLIDDNRDPTVLMARDLLSYILLGNAAAPLRKALIDSGLGEEVVGGYESDLLQQTFSVGMKGIDPANAGQIEDLILRTLAELAEQGIDPETVAAAFNTFEFSLRENNTGSFPRGLVLMLRALGTWLYDDDPIAPLRFEAPLAAVRTAVANGERLFERLIRELLLDNPHRTRVTLRPDPEHAARLAAAEQARIDAFAATLDDAKRAALVAETQALAEWQQTPDPPEAIAAIPTLRLADLDRAVKRIPTEIDERGGARLLRHNLFTNGIVYLDLAFDLRALSPHLLPYVPLFARALTEMGTATSDFVRLLQRIGRETGGIYAATMTATDIVSTAPVGRLIVRGKSTVAQTTELLRLLSEILLTVNLDNRERFRQIVLRARANKESSLVPAGNAYARQRLAARFAPAEWADEQMGGVSAIFFLRELEQRVQHDWPSVLADLEAVRAALINRRGLVANLTLDADNQQAVLPMLTAFLSELPDAAYNPAHWPVRSVAGGEGLVIPAQVNYVAKGVDLHALGIRPSGAAMVVLRHLRIDYLLDRIRIQGGAYGAGGNYDRSTGLFITTSYRDPNLLRTLDVYDEMATFLRETALDPATVERAIIGTIGDMDAYQLPDAKGYTALVRYLTSVSDEYRQQIRDEVLATTPADFVAFAEAAAALRDHGQVAVLGSAEAIEAANRERPGLLTPVKIL
ncbi:peptidase M16 [Chloroflexus islandicus]|uniref:Peptidase M16 n=1 Tax=Chloroflexus islandicus TaxID=1707952 RepID=A0A178MGV5_9CHLR|nr:insulinase family protein [Chloroflexus islandicus]OAN47234.1 peptidase M16 [Chloroflexus islandicus]